MKDEKEKIGVSDIGLVSLLATLNFQIVELKRVDEKRVNFIFARADGLEQVIADYWADVEMTVPIQGLFNNHKLLKNRLYAHK